MSEELIEKFNLTLSDVPVDLHRAWKAMSALKGIAMKDSALDAIRDWVKAQSKDLENEVAVRLSVSE